MTYKVAFDSTSSETGWLFWYMPVLIVSLVMLAVVLWVIWKDWRGSRRIALIAVGITLSLSCSSPTGSFTTTGCTQNSCSTPLHIKPWKGG